ncbi:DMT family transporter [Marimonas lutisalis]|uniref:DMT family transporter n=1 Tax=Marimonas lutisalis TaxID=2545756 RepID=UPI0010F7C2D3|nr:DMT family transporter [Marimonas lutisalis]
MRQLRTQRALAIFPEANLNVPNERALQFVLLIIVGATWGMTNPLAKISVSTGYSPLGIMFWQLVIVISFAGFVLVMRGHRLPLHRKALVLYAVIALTGTLIPDFLLYTSAAHIPAGILSIIMAVSPMIALPMALLIGIERFDMRRTIGTVLGLGAVVLMVGPKDGLAGPTETVFALVALCSAAFYAVQGNFIIWYSQTDIGPMRMLVGSSALGLLVITPFVVATDQFIDPRGIWTSVEWAIVGTGGLHALAYAGYLALIAQSGPVFASQVAYVVTATGMLWSILLLSEGYSNWVWLSFVLVMIAIRLVQPRRTRPL